MILKRAFTFVELAVVISMIMIISTLMLVGVSRARENEGLKADYLEFYEVIKSLKVRANLGKLAPSGTTTVQTLTFTMPNATSYSINGGAAKTFKNGSKISQVNSSVTGGVVTISFVPDVGNYLGPTPAQGVFAIRGGSTLGANVTITLIGESSSGPTYTIYLNGSGYYIRNISRS